MFSAKVFAHSLLKSGEVIVPAIVSVKTDGAAEVGGPAADFVFGGIVDCSGSMGGAKIANARNAMRKVVASLPETAYLFIVAGGASGQTRTVFPLAQATAANKRAADNVVAHLSADWGTHISGWLEEAERQFAGRSNAIKRGLLLTDGQNDENDSKHKNPNGYCKSISARCKGKFQLDCRGVGEGWDVPLLTHIANDLLGSVDVIKTPEEMEEEFRAILKDALSKSMSDVRIRILCPFPGTTIDYFKQVAPALVDLSTHGVSMANPAGPGTVFEFPTGAWSKEESRDYQVGIKLAKPGDVNRNRILAGRASVLLRQNGTDTPVKLDNASIAVAWTDNDAASVLAVPPELTRFGKEGALVQKVQAAIVAKEKGETALATKLLGEANVIAEEVGNEGTKKLIREVAVVDEHTKRVVALKTDAKAEDWIAAGTRSVRTKVLDGK